MIEKYKDRLRRILSDEKVVKKRRSTKRRSAKKRRSTKRRSAKRRRSKRRSRFGANETLREKINNIIANGANADEEEDVPPIPTRARNSLPPPLPHPLRPPSLPHPLPPLQHPLPPLQPPIAPKAAAEPARRVWGTPGVRSEPAPQPTVGFNKQVPAVGSSLSAARAAEGAKWVEKEVDKLVNEIKIIGYKDEKGRWAVKFITLFNHYENISDSLVGIMIRAQNRGRIEYDGKMLFQGINDDVVITVIED